MRCIAVAIEARREVTPFFGGRFIRLLTIGLVLAVALVLSDSTASARPIPFQRSVTVGEWGPTALAPRATAETLHRLARDVGVDTVTLFLAWEQDNSASTEIGPGIRTARTERLVHAIRAARKLGLRVILRPYVDLRDGGWRGHIQPSSLDRWFESYGSFISRFAGIAQRERASGLVVGTEMVSLSDEAVRWRRLVRRVRSRFKGFVTYQANWDEAGNVTWWDALDAISISAYHPLTHSLHYSVASLVHGWRSYFRRSPSYPANWRMSIQTLHRRFRKPVMFGEIGYRAIEGSAVHPWDISVSGAPSPEAQKKAYEAAFRVWYRIPWFRGFHWWYVSPQPKLVDGFPGADHRPTRATLRLVGRWYRKNRR
jgi:hypothetical protein